MSKKILIAEDELPLLKAMSTKLRNLGYEVVTASNGLEAVKVFLASNPDLVLLDIIMPEKNGFEVLAEIKNNYKSPTPVIILTNLDQNQDIITGQNLGAVDYVLKSNISLRDLAAKVAHFLGISSETV